MGRKDAGQPRVSKTDQRGRVGGWGTHLSQQAHQNYITCGTMLTENQLETGKRLLHDYSCKKVTENQVGREEQWSGQDSCPGRGLARAQRSSLWSEWFQPHTGCPRKMRSPGWLEGWQYKQKGCGKPGPHSRGASTGLLIPEAGQKRQTETTKVSD